VTSPPLLLLLLKRQFVSADVSHCDAVVIVSLSGCGRCVITADVVLTDFLIHYYAALGRHITVSIRPERAYNSNTEKSQHA